MNAKLYMVKVFDGNGKLRHASKVAASSERNAADACCGTLGYQVAGSHPIWMGPVVSYQLSATTSKRRGVQPTLRACAFDAFGIIAEQFLRDSDNVDWV